jgi:hypothetical protein
MNKNKKQKTNYFNNTNSSELIDTIISVQNCLELKSTRPSINIELEGVYFDNQHLPKDEFYNKTNLQLHNFGIKAKLKPEFWNNQWEYESNLQIGNVNQTIDSYQKFLKNINQIFSPQIPKIEPISYNWQKLEDRVIHIPNSIQINISLWKEGFNILANKNYAIFLQNLLIKNSIQNLIFFIPDQKSLDRLFLKEKYSLQDKLISPCDISGGRKGSIACYLEKNKKNLPNVLNIDFDNLDYKIAGHQYTWQKNARIEFRLASASLDYNLELHILFVMIIALESLMLYKEDKNYEEAKNCYRPPAKFYHHRDDNIISRYKNGSFFKKKIAFFLKNEPKEELSKLAEQLRSIEIKMDNLIKIEELD